MNVDFARYTCQMNLPGFSREGQLALQNARVLVVGAGGLGCPAAQYLAAAGVGTLGIADFDTVSVGNLHRQVLYNPADAGKKKVTVACERLHQQNPGIKLVPHDLYVDSQSVMDLIRGYDMIVDGTDNFETRYLLNDAAVITGKPVVYGAIYQFEGQVAVWNVTSPNGTKSPNYRDLFPKVDASQIPNCAEGGVIPTLAGIIGCMQANEVIKYVTQTGELLAGKILVFDAQSMQSRVIKMGAVSGTKITRLVETVRMPTISVADLKVKLAENSISLVDVRTEAEHESFNIGGTNVPLENIYSYMDGFDKDAETIFYCSTGKRSGEAVKTIKAKFPDAGIFSLAGGLKEWLES